MKIKKMPIKLSKETIKSNSKFIRELNYKVFQKGILPIDKWKEKNKNNKVSKVESLTFSDIDI